MSRLSEPKITCINSAGITIEDEDMYEIMISHEHLPTLLAKLNIAMSLPQDIYPLGGKLHPGCVIDEVMEKSL